MGVMTRPGKNASESCCFVPAVNREVRDCPRCGERGQSVERLTVAALTTGIAPVNQRYWLCRELACEAVYFGEDATVITAAAMTVAPGFKSKASDALVCYCFQHRRGDLEAELAAGGETTIPSRISAEVKAGNCACEVRNPSGKCCLGEVQRAAQEIRVRLGALLEPASRGRAAPAAEERP